MHSKRRKFIKAGVAAAWSAITPHTEVSNANNGEPQDFPDFTRGQWITNKSIFTMKGDEY